MKSILREILIIGNPYFTWKHHFEEVMEEFLAIKGIHEEIEEDAVDLINIEFRFVNNEEDRTETYSLEQLGLDVENYITLAELENDVNKVYVEWRRNKIRASCYRAWVD